MLSIGNNGYLPTAALQNPEGRGELGPLGNLASGKVAPQKGTGRRPAHGSEQQPADRRRSSHPGRGRRTTYQMARLAADSPGGAPAEPGRNNGGTARTQRDSAAPPKARPAAPCAGGPKSRPPPMLTS